MYTWTDDTIVAISSAAGGGERGIVRLSGPAAVAIADRLVKFPSGGRLVDAAGWTVHAGEILLTEAHRAPADIYLFRAPRSYTRQDLVELHTLGSPPLLNLVVERCLAGGARLAHPGEFTARAFLAGGQTLAEAESVAAVIDARSDAQLRAARHMRASHLAEEVAGWQMELAHLRSLVEADIDFAEEAIEFIQPAELVAGVEALRARLAGLQSAGRASERVELFPRILLMGLPNAGKSTLLNRLSGLDRAIASAVAGTTRDLLTAPARFGDAEALLIDTAGWDSRGDPLASAANAQALAAAGSADCVCLLVDGSAPPDEVEWSTLLRRAGVEPVIVANKSDLVPSDRRDAACANLPGEVRAAPLWVSALSGEGIDTLRAVLAERLAGTVADDAAIALSARQRTSLAEAAEALARCSAGAQSAGDLLAVAELLAADLREAQDALAELTGAVTTEDLLSRIFASFCIGK